MIDRQSDRSQVAWDIETTGFGWHDEITVAGFWFPSGHAAVLVNTDGERVDVDAYDQQVNALADGLYVTVHACEHERDLLTSMHKLVFERVSPEYDRLVAFNADSWQGGFDLPFVRTRCAHHDHAWVFDGLQFADLWEPVTKRLNTTHTTHGNSTDVNSLTGSHDILFSDTRARTVLTDLPDDYPQYQAASYDPFSDSGSAVYCYSNGEFLPVIAHNLADIHRTWELGELVRQYVPSKDITIKKL